jgi:predicted alpha-1,2-mannosidase
MKMYFAATLDQTPDQVGTFRGTETHEGETSIQGPGAGLYVTFSNAQKPVLVKLGLSYTSIANARTNLLKEATDLSFDSAREQAQAKWAEMLGRIEVNGGKETDRTKFYSGLYHALLGRGLASDVNGAYPRNDGAVGQLPLDPDGRPTHNHYHSDSVWGTFWNLNQLWALAYPDYLSEYLRCHLDLYRECGWLPDSIAAAKFVSGVGTDYMGVLVSSAYAWGIRDYDVNQAFAAVLKNELGWQNRPIGVGKADLKSFVDRGYVPLLRNAPAYSGSVAEGSQFSASHTLEYSFSCHAAAQFALRLGKTNEHALLMRYASGWENLYDPETHFIRPKDQEGKFINDFNPRKPWVGFQEGNAWQYTFYVPHDISGLTQRMGLETFRKRLDDVFAQAEKTGFGGGQKLDAFSGLENVYNHGNQPSLHISWLFNQSGRPWLTQYWVRRICDVFYGTDRTHGYGYGQDEDQGQLGAWYVLAALGLFDVQGGTALEPTMQLSTPFFEQVRIKLHPRYYSGKAFEVQASGDPASSHYIDSAELDGQPLNRYWIPWQKIVDGGRLKLNLTAGPNKSWGN